MSVRVFLIRHGETEWSAAQKHTGSTDLPLTEKGENEIKKARASFVGTVKLIDPASIRRVYCSPRTRALQTAEILFPNITSKSQQSNGPKLEVAPCLQEWDYGDYEGLTRDQVFQARSDQGVENYRDWNIWRDGCAGGESPVDVSLRLGNFISRLKNEIEKEIKENPNQNRPGDIVCVAHGHILSSLAMVWAKIPLGNGVRLLLETAGVATLGFEHDDVNEPAIFIGVRPRS
ncbi:uncharacterized protein TRUGW13939_10509 [Talaromyces rugulosus]|uniref:Phosphoglycerate mutase n=1 Tax=Talaromyces rugulosus TaxID=121627 RepID=A0A7H8RA73_TALRU|nr:uncharacterized protein TRUGW13939_10509 [Talaromyces rugulosus]QKX63339.1 hypothetical protein TRUGW13939_10509 [Talaromyces rugulosus]